MNNKLNAKVDTFYQVECIRNGKVVWQDECHNLVVTGGLDRLLDAAFVTGTQGAPTWFMGLVDGETTPEFLPEDTMAVHEGWIEFAKYDEIVRQPLVLGAISGGMVDNASNRGIFHINGTGLVYGFCLVDDDEIEGTDGTLYGVGGFSGGQRDVEAGDVLRVAATLTLST